VGNVYVIIEVPGATPVNIPTALIVAAAVLPLIHVPPPVGAMTVASDPTHTVLLPVKGAGNGFTVIIVVILHVVGSVYVIVAVPADTPVTSPEEAPTDTEPLALLHVPPVVGSERVIDDATHTDELPVIAAGRALTVTIVVL
jgi:hypothetical protein